VSRARWVGLRNVDEWAAQLRDRTWWIVRADWGEAFIIGDSPVVSATAIGQDGGWGPLLGDGSTVLAFPLAPTAGLLISGPLLPTTTDRDGIVSWVNRSTWRSATEYVAAQSRELLETVRASIPADVDATISFPSLEGEGFLAGVGSSYRSMASIWLELDRRRFPLRSWTDRRCVMSTPEHGAEIRSEIRQR
jgi:hypothetical protein